MHNKTKNAIEDWEILSIIFNSKMENHLWINVGKRTNNTRNQELTTASCMKMHGEVFFVPSSYENGG